MSKSASYSGETSDGSARSYPSEPDDRQHQTQLGALLVAAKVAYVRGARGKISQFGRKFFAGQHPYPPKRKGR